MTQPGDVVVFDCHGYDQAGHFGDIVVLSCKVRGIAGVIIGGSCWDAEDIKALCAFPFLPGASTQSKQA